MEGYLSAFIDCRIEKLIKLLPNVDPYLFLNNRWAMRVEYDWAKEAVRINYDIEERTEVAIYNLFAVEYHREYDEEVRISEIKLPVIVSCDLYNLPYANNYYHKAHVIHYLLVERWYDDAVVVVYDDNPRYHGVLETSAIFMDQASFRSTVPNLPVYEWFDNRNSVIPSKLEKKEFIQEYVDTQSINFASGIEFMLYDKMDTFSCIKILGTLTLASKKLYSLPLFIEQCDHLQQEIRNELVLLARKYVDQWSILSNLACKCQHNELIWDRIVKRIVILIESEVALKKKLTEKL